MLESDVDLKITVVCENCGSSFSFRPRLRPEEVTCPVCLRNNSLKEENHSKTATSIQ